METIPTPEEKTGAKGETPRTKKTGKKTLRTICFTALFAAITAGGSFIAIPLGPVPVVLQNLFALLAGLTLGPLRGSAAVGLYLLAGVLNFPVFAGGTGGIARLMGPTGGFLAGYLLMALTGGLILGKPRGGEKVPPAKLIAAVAAGFLVVYVPGILWLKIRAHYGWAKALMTGFVPFIIGDILKGIAAALITPRLRSIVADYLDG
jgi:biotin transport system substrate-specific component